MRKRLLQLSPSPFACRLQIVAFLASFLSMMTGFANRAFGFLPVKRLISQSFRCCEDHGVSCKAVKHYASIRRVLLSTTPKIANPSLNWEGVSHSTSDFVTHVLVPAELHNITKLVDLVESALEDQKRNENTVTNLTAGELIALGSVWFLPVDAPRNPAHGAKPQRLLSPDYILSEGDYLRIHHNPRRFMAVYDYDWSRYVHETRTFQEKGSRPGVWVGRDADKGWLVIDKPPLISVHPTVDNSLENVAGFIQQALKHMQEGENELPYVTTPHRLDQNTSGLFVVATSKAFAAYYASLLRRKTEKRLLEEESCDGIHKRYKCLVCLLPPQGSSTETWSAGKAAHQLQELARAGTLVRHFLEPSIRAPKRFVNEIPVEAISEKNETADSQPLWPECLLRVKHASEIYPVVGNAMSKDLSSKLWSQADSMPCSCQAVIELEVELLTGRTHQIRGQFAAMGFPLVGDSLYGGAHPQAHTVHTATGNLALQCSEMEFIDPDIVVRDDGAIVMKRSKRWNRFSLEEAWWTPFLKACHQQNEALESQFATTLASDIGLTEASKISSTPTRTKTVASSSKPPRPELLPNRVSLSPGKNKYVLVRATHPGDSQVRWFVKSAAPSDCGGAYHGNVAQDLREWIEAAGYQVQVTGGGRIDYRPDEQKATIYGFSYAFGRGDHARAASMIREWSKKLTVVVENADGLY